MTSLPELNIGWVSGAEFATVRVALVNSSQFAFWVRNDLVFGGPLKTLEDRNLLFEIVDSADRVVPYQCLVERAPARKMVMRMLRPGDTVIAEYLLSPCYALEQAKSYSVRAEYHPGPYSHVGSPEGSRAIAKTLMSNMLRLAATKPNSTP